MSEHAPSEQIEVRAALLLLDQWIRETRTPLLAVKGYSDLLARSDQTCLSDDQRGCLDNLAKNVQRLIEMHQTATSHMHARYDHAPHQERDDETARPPSDIGEDHAA